MCIAPQVSFQAPPQKKPSEPEVDVIVSPSSEVINQNGVQSPKFNPPQIQIEKSLELEWEVNDLDDYFPPYYYLPQSKNHLILKCSPLNYSKSKPSKSFSAIAQSNLQKLN